MDHYEDDETPALLRQLLRQNATDGFGPSAENPAAQYEDNYRNLTYRAPSVASSRHSGHSARSILPSVLNPTASGFITFTYEQACGELKKFCEEASQDGSSLGERTIAVVAYDEKGGQTSCHQVRLTIDLSLKSLITILQELIDQREHEPSHKGKGRFLIKSIEVRSGQASDKLFPAIEGTIIEATQTSLVRPAAQWITWDCAGGPMDSYWKYYRIAIQLGLGVGPNGPILKLRTVKCKDTWDFNSAGHLFNAGGSQYQRARRYSGGKPPGGGIFGHMPSGGGASGSRPQLNPIASAFKFGITIEEAIDDTSTQTDYKGKGKAVAVETSDDSGLSRGADKKVVIQVATDENDGNTTTEWKKAPIPDWDSLPPAINHNPGGYQAKPTSWTYWQNIGGDGKAAKEFPLGHIPYPETPDVDHCDYIPGEQFNMKATIANAMKALANNEEPVMPEKTPEEQAVMDKIMAEHRREFDSARGFESEDDDIYIPTLNPNWDPNGPKDQLTKGKEATPSPASMSNVPARYRTPPQPVVEARTGPPSYVTAYYGRPTHSTSQLATMVSPMAGNTSGALSNTGSPVRFASPRTTQSKSTFPSGGRARPFTPGQMTSFQSLAGSRSGTPPGRFGGNTTSFAMPSTSAGFVAPPNTISRSRSSSPANALQMAEQFGGMSLGAQGPLRGHHNQLFVPGLNNSSISTTQGHGSFPQNFEDWNAAAQGDTRYTFPYKFDFGNNGNGGNGGGS